MSVDFDQMVQILRLALDGGVTTDGGYSHVYKFDPPRYGRKWMTRRAARWKRRRWIPEQFTIEYGDPAALSVLDEAVGR